MQSCFLQELKPCMSQTAGSMLCTVTRHAGLSLSSGSVLSQSSTMSCLLGKSPIRSARLQYLLALDELDCDRNQGWVEGEVQEASLCLCWDQQLLQRPLPSTGPGHTNVFKS